MPTITLNKTVFEELVGKKLPLDQLKDRISMLGTDLEKIEGDQIHVEVFPNRPDMLSEQGFARALSSFIGVKTGLRTYPIKPSGCQVIVDPSVTMRPYTACAIVKNITFTDERIREVMQMQEKLATTHGRNRKKSAYGVYPLDAICFPITYIAKDPKKVMFQPLGLEKKIPAHLVEEQHAMGQKFKHLAVGWKKYPFFIDARQNVMCMLPYTNSEDTGKVTVETKNMFVECTGNDLQNVTVALNMFAAMFADMGGEVYSLQIQYPDQTLTTPDFTPRKMKLNLPYINRRLGLEMTEKEAQLLLEKMGYGFERGEVLIPAYRADILHQVDLMEDIAIAYGYENFKEEIPNVATIGQEDHFAVFCRRVREIVIGYGLEEVKNYHLMTKEELQEKMLLSVEPVALKNAVGEHNHLRNALVPSLLRTLTENQQHEYPQNIFEMGRVFFLEPVSETGVGETDHLSLAIAHDTADITEARQILDGLARALGLAVSVKETQVPPYIPGRVGEIILQGRKVGLIGEIHPQVLTYWKLTVPVSVVELNLREVEKIVKSEDS